MKIHHLNTGTMCPMGRRLVNGTGSLFQRARLVCHCLLVETADGLALVDTGIGLGDIATPDRLGPRWLRQTAPKLDPAETAVAQVRALGYSPKRRTPRAADASRPRSRRRRARLSPRGVHVHRAEYDMAVLRKPAPPEGRYVTGQWSHGPSWKFYDEPGEDWFGFKGVRALGDREATS